MLPGLFSSFSKRELLVSCTGFSLPWLLLLQSSGSRVQGLISSGSRPLERRFNSCGAPIQLPWGLRDSPGSGIEPMSPEMAGWFFTAEPPGPGASAVKNPPTKQEMQVWSLGWEDPLEKEMATHSSILAWEIPWREEPGGLQSVGSPKSQTLLSD